MLKNFFASLTPLSFCILSTFVDAQVHSLLAGQPLSPLNWARTFRKRFPRWNTQQ